MLASREWLGSGKSGNSLCREKVKITPLLVSAANSTVYCSYCQVKTLQRALGGVEDIFASLSEKSHSVKECLRHEHGPKKRPQWFPAGQATALSPKCIR